jgi:arylsulfatase
MTRSSRKRHSRRTAHLLAALAVWAAGCAPAAESERRDLWSEEARWSRTDAGWVHAVPLAAAKSLPASGFERFRTVVFPASGGATIVLRTEKGRTERRVSSPTALDFDLQGAARASLSATGEVHLLRPRLVPRAGGRGRRILLTVADTLRFDHATDELMPESTNYFFGPGAGGLRFERAYSPASWTLPSLAAVFTGQRPSLLRTPDGTLISLPPRFETLASRLRARGYVTAAVIANYTVNHENGFSRGFDFFHSPVPPEQVAGRFPDAREICERALAAAGWFTDEDLFLYLQYMEPHEPYRDHRTGRRWNTLPRGEDPGPERLAAMRAAYASEVRHLDRWLGALLSELGELDLAVFTSDHGDEFFEHGGFSHGPTLYEEVVRVPLWVRGRGIPGRTVAAPVPLKDLGVLLVEGPEAFLDSPRPVTMETYSFGPPRFSAILGRQQWTLFARRIVSADAEHPTARWLEEHHPRISVTTLEGGRPAAPREELVGRALRLLQRHFEGHRRGLFIELRNLEEIVLEVSGAERDGLLWGDAEHVAVIETGSGKLRIEARRPRPFAVLFLPAAGAVEVGVADGGGEATWTAARGPRLADGVKVWLDPGRPEVELRESQVTLERLRALGYI